MKDLLNVAWMFAFATLFQPLAHMAWWLAVIEVIWMLAGPFICWTVYPYTFGALQFFEMSPITFWTGRLGAALGAYGGLMVINYILIRINHWPTSLDALPVP